MVSLVEYNSAFLALSWKWLNDNEIKQLTNTSDFTEEEQKIWFKGLKNNNDYLIWGIEVDNKPIGACGLKNITNSDCEYWGYIGEKEYWGRGMGSNILEQIEYKAKAMSINSIWLKVVKNNERAIKLYKKIGFIAENESSELIVMRKYI